MHTFRGFQYTQADMRRERRATRGERTAAAQGIRVKHEDSGSDSRSRDTELPVFSSSTSRLLRRRTRDLLPPPASCSACPAHSSTEGHCIRDEMRERERGERRSRTRGKERRGRASESALVSNRFPLHTSPAPATRLACQQQQQRRRPSCGRCQPLVAAVAAVQQQRLLLLPPISLALLVSAHVAFAHSDCRAN